MSVVRALATAGRVKPSFGCKVGKRVARKYVLATPAGKKMAGQIIGE